jgi:hypothetical protein
MSNPNDFYAGRDELENLLGLKTSGGSATLATLLSRRKEKVKRKPVKVERQQPNNFKDFYEAYDELNELLGLELTESGQSGQSGQSGGKRNPEKESEKESKKVKRQPKDGPFKNLDEKQLEDEPKARLQRMHDAGREL